MDSVRSNKGDTPRVPISLEGERRKAMKLLYEVEKDLKQFIERWLKDTSDDFVDEWLDFISMAKAKYGPNYVFKGPKAFGKELQKIQNSEGFLGERVLTIAQLTRVVERARHFEELYESSHRKLEDALTQYLSRYCLSFFPELDEFDIECVREYENHINTCQLEIRKYLDNATTSKEDMEQMVGKNFVDYIQFFSQVQSYMTSALKSLMKVSEPMRSWVTGDEGYVRRLMIETSNLKQRRSAIAETLRRNHIKQEETRSKLNRSSFQYKKLNETLQKKIQDRKFCRKREFSFVDKIDFNEQVLQEKKFELEELLDKLEKKPMNSYVKREQSSVGLRDRAYRMQGEITRLEKQLKKMRRGKRDMRETRYMVQKELHALKGEREDRDKASRRQTEFASHQQADTRALTEEMRQLDCQVAALRRIIKIKTHPSTVKRIYFQGYAPGERIDLRGAVSQEPEDPPDTFREAISVAATEVGRDYDKMYHGLPFNPPRTPHTRSTDLEVIDMSYKGVHPPSEDMALKSLQKWSSLSKVTSVNALVRTLRSIKKSDVAKKIEKQVLTVVN